MDGERGEHAVDRFTQLEDALLGGPRMFTRAEVARELDLDIEEADKVWRAFGLARDPRDQAIFTEDDLGAMGLMTVAFRRLPEGPALASARATAHQMARLADWQARRLDALGRGDATDATVAETALAISRLQDIVWRRHLALALDGLEIGRVADAGGGRDGQELAVGFCEIVDYTGLSRSLGIDELAVLLETFEGHVSRIVTARGGRVVKTLGDAVMFTVTESVRGVELGGALHGLSRRDRMPQVRVGMAHGRVLARLGDVFGEPVNIAARLTSSARPGTTLYDAALVRSVDGEPVRFRSIGLRNVRGYGRLVAHVVTGDRDPGQNNRVRGDRPP
ncbi:adenylate/guanylate cyclase domain-containing protein [Williamsia sp. M5A3_1d]